MSSIVRDITGEISVFEHARTLEAAARAAGIAVCQPVLRAMRKEGINIIAIHQHMSHEQPRHLFLHYWGKGKRLI